MILRYFNQYRVQVSNFAYLSIVQFGNMILPLIVLPFLLNRLGIDNYGLFVFSQSIAAYFAVFIRFGFNTYATQQVSRFSENKSKLNEIFINVIFLELLFFLISIGVMLGYFYIFPVKYNEVYIYSLIAAFIESLLPIWYFQGIERMKYITLINLIAKIISLICILFFVDNSLDYLIVPICYLIGSLTVLFISLFILMKHKVIKCNLPTLQSLFFYLKNSIVFVFSDLMAILKDKTNIMLLGTFVGMNAVAYYDLAEKIVWAFRSVFSNINIAFFPYFSRNKRPEQVKQVILIIFIFSLLSYLFVCLFSDFIILSLSNENMLIIKDFLWIMAMYIIIASLSSSIGYFILIVNGHSKSFFYNMLISLISYLFICFFIYSLFDISIINLVIAYNLSILIELLHRIYLCGKYRLLNWII